VSEDYPGNRVIEALGLRDGPDQIERDLEGLWGNYLGYNESTAEPALTALNEIVFGRSDRPNDSFGGMDPKSRVEIPWWVAWAISVRWSAYMKDSNTATLGQAFGVEGRGQGKRRFIATQKTRNWKRGYALEVAYERKITQPRPTVEAAVGTVAQRWGVSDDTVWQAWNEFRDLVNKAVAQTP
jgi:hypothetical protein